MANAKLKVIQELLVEELCDISKLPNMEITGCQENYSVVNTSFSPVTKEDMSPLWMDVSPSILTPQRADSHSRRDTP